MSIEDDARDAKLAEQEIIRQSLEEKIRRIWELERKVEILEETLNRLASVRGTVPPPGPQPSPTIRPAPRRWAVR
ncbi:MAG: hypothetical protein HYZ73_07225 [Elusimicrobia bacterium]|nr:hypothetical protein [Elusimicrobiota bacterium]